MDENNSATPGVWHDWVGELFEPAFGATIEDLVAHEEDHKNEPSIKHISVFDPDRVHKVYEKVHMMTLLDEEMRKQRREQATALKKDRPRPAKPASSDTARTDRPAIPPGHVAVDLNQSCIWDSNEIAVLREAFKAIKQQNIDAMVHVREVEKRNKELEELAAKQKKTIESQKAKLTDAKNANSRLKINVDSLNEEVQYLTAKVGAMEDVIREIKQEHADMVEELHDNRVATDRERMERERIQIKLDCLKQEALVEKHVAEDNIRAMCRQTIHDLREKVKKLDAELKEERTKRKITEKGLNHLRSHFSSLSVQDIVPPNSVRADQVGKVQY